MKYLIIGGSIAAINAVEAIREYDTNGDITVVSEEKELPYSRPLISYWLGREISDREMLYRPADFYEINSVRLLFGKRAVAINNTDRSVKLDDGQVLSYDRLLLACGGKSIIPPGLDNVTYHTFYSWQDVRRLAATVKPGSSPPQHALVVGAGLVGLKAAESLRMLGLKVTVTDLAGHLLSSILPARAAKFLERLLLREEGLQFYFNTTATEFEMNGEQIRCKIGEIPAVFDNLVTAIGVRPNLDLLRAGDQGTSDSSNSVNINKGVIVGERMQTNIPGIFAAGDLVEACEPVSGERRVTAILPNAARQGRIAGAAMTGNDVSIEETTVFNSLNLFGHSLVTVGLTTVEAENGASVRTEVSGNDRMCQLLHNGNRLLGAVLINMPERSGIYRALIERKAEVKEENLFQPKLLSLPPQVWSELEVS